VTNYFLLCNIKLNSLFSGFTFHHSLLTSFRGSKRAATLKKLYISQSSNLIKAGCSALHCRLLWTSVFF